MRKSRCAQLSFAVELQRLHAMSVEDRVLEALGMHTHFAGLDPTPMDR